MRTYYLLALACFAAGAAQAESKHSDAAAGAGVEVEGSALGADKIKWVRPRTVDVDKIFGEDGGGVERIGRKEHASTLPKQSIGFDDKKLSDPFPTGVRFEQGAGQPPFEGLMQSQNDANGNVAKISIPGDPATTLNNPVKADGTPLTQMDLMRLGQGKTKSIPLQNGKTLGSPSSPVSG